MHLSAADRYNVYNNGATTPNIEDIPMVIEEANNNNNQHIQGLASQRPSGRSGRKKRKNRKKKMDDLDLSGHFIADPGKQPALLSTIRLQAGVSAKEGTASRDGPAKVDNGLRMSRKDFSAHQSRLEQTSSKPGMVSVGDW